MVIHAPVNVLENAKVRALAVVRDNVKVVAVLDARTVAAVNVLVAQMDVTDALEPVMVAQIAVKVVHLVTMIAIPRVFLNVEVAAHLNVEMAVKMAVILDVRIAVSRLAQKPAMALV